MRVTLTTISTATLTLRTQDIFTAVIRQQATTAARREEATGRPHQERGRHPQLIESVDRPLFVYYLHDIKSVTYA